MSRLLSLSLLCGACLLAAMGCDDGQEPPAPPDPDKARECVEGGGTPTGEAGMPEGGMAADGGVVGGCGLGEVCVQGRCYDRCTSDEQCGPREECGSGGTCVRRAGPEPDAGMMTDAGPGDPCDSVMCTDPEVCHPLSHQCTECNEESVVAPPGSPGRCSGLRPICDIANGRCVEAGPAQCAPCNVDAECDPGDGSFVGRCVVRDIMDWREQVCMQTCDSTTPCPAGLECTSDMVCEPYLGVSCTTWQAFTTARACSGDEDCNIAGSTGSSSFFTQTCEGEIGPMDPDGGDGDGGPGDAGTGTPGACVQPCADTTECYDEIGGQMCTDTGTGLTFCVVP